MLVGSCNCVSIFPKAYSAYSILKAAKHFSCSLAGELASGLAPAHISGVSIPAQEVKCSIRWSLQCLPLPC